MKYALRNGEVMCIIPETQRNNTAFPTEKRKRAGRSATKPADNKLGESGSIPITGPYQVSMHHGGPFLVILQPSLTILDAKEESANLNGSRMPLT